MTVAHWRLLMHCHKALGGVLGHEASWGPAGEGKGPLFLRVPGPRRSPAPRLPINWDLS
jgi:hypothetical protein